MARSDRVAVDVLDFGKLIEEAFKSLAVAETVILKVKLISLRATEGDCVSSFVKAGLSRDAATLIALMMQKARL